MNNSLMLEFTASFTTKCIYTSRALRLTSTHHALNNTRPERLPLSITTACM